MSVSDITVAALAATPTFRGNHLAWTYSDPRSGALPNIALDMVEVYSSTTNDFATATKVGEGVTDFLHSGLVEEQTYYYWIQARDNIGGIGAKHPTGATSGAPCVSLGVSGLAFGLANGKLVATVASNALTIAVKTAAGNDPSASDPVYIAFRNSTLTTGNYQVRAVMAALSLTLPSGATAGFVSSVPGRLWANFVDTGSAVKLAVQNCSTSTATFGLPEYGLVTTVLADTASDSAGVMYADSVLTSRPFRIAGFFDWNSGLATAGTWASVPDVIQMFGPGVKKPGDIVQTILTLNNTYSEAEAHIPYDDTIPQSSEGREIFSTAITPTSKVNYIENFSVLNASHSANVILAQALFQDSGADAIATTFCNSNSAPVSWPLFDRRQAGTTSQTTYKLRVGDSTTPGPSTAVNGFGGSRKYGGAMESYHKVSEIMA